MIIRQCSFQLAQPGNGGVHHARQSAFQHSSLGQETELAQADLLAQLVERARPALLEPPADRKGFLKRWDVWQGICGWVITAVREALS